MKAAIPMQITLLKNARTMARRETTMASLLPHRGPQPTELPSIWLSF
jgi:hypothetical protein